MYRCFTLAAAFAALLLTGCATHYRFAEGAGQGDYRIVATEKEIQLLLKLYTNMP